MHTPISRLICLPLLASLLAAPLAAAAYKDATFPLKDGDIWVFAGDSITAQKMHTNYFEAFCFARYPKMKFAFRNSGVGGHTIPTTMARFDYDIAAWKPTVVSVELGMNDKGGFTPEQYITNMGKMTEKIRAIKARPVYFTASPVNNGDTMAHLGGNTRLHDYAVGLKRFAAQEKAPFADQFHALLDIWGRNTALLNLLNNARSAATDDGLAGVEHLRAFLQVQEKSGKKPVSLLGDAVHPGQPGQLTMAAALLKDLGADGFVSSVTIDAAGKKGEAKGCSIDNISVGDNAISFDRLDDCLPFPIPDEARSVLPIYPTILDLSQYTLRVNGLKGEKYELKINNKPVATVTAKELADGVNLTAFPKGPIADQGKEILTAVNAKEGIVQQWRGQSKTVNGDVEKLAPLTAKVEEADAKIRAAAKPRKLHFELQPVK
jgi:lysophospholipase L1-like esterase